MLLSHQLFYPYSITLWVSSDLCRYNIFLDLCLANELIDYFLMLAVSNLGIFVHLT